MRIHRIIAKTAAEGPGKRFALWVQGCPHRCEGCFATDTWSSDGGETISLDDLIASFDAVRDAVDGVTLLGGEPFAQADELAPFTQHVRAFGKSIITFTGYTYRSLCGMENPAVHTVLQNTDILIDGRYEKALTDYSRPLAGSSNQRILFLSDRITEEEFYAYRNIVEVRTDKSGRIQFNGMGDFQTIKSLIGG